MKPKAKPTTVAGDLKSAVHNRFLEGNTRCPRCLGYHSVTTNFDGLCDGCQKIMTDYRRRVGH